MGRREINVEIFRDTMMCLNGSEKLMTAAAETRQNQKLFLTGQEIPERSSRKNDCRTQDAHVIVSGKRTLEAASAYMGKKVCILNFASATNPGGGVVHGASAQEECLCRCSTLYSCLDTPEMMRDFYLPHRRAKNPLHNDDIIYSPGVYVIKTDTSFPERMNEDDWYRVNVITCAAPNLRERPDSAGNYNVRSSNVRNSNAWNKASRITRRELHSLLETRIRRIFQVASAEENEVLIPGAFGCGAFSNPPDVVADVFRLMTKEFIRQFETIEYAVYHTDRDKENYKAFQCAFEEYLREV